MWNGCQLEAGPDSYIAAKPQVTELAADIPELNEIIGTNDKDRRIFLVKDGALVAMPRGMVMMVPADMREALRSPYFLTALSAASCKSGFRNHASGKTTSPLRIWCATISMT